MGALGAIEQNLGLVALTVIAFALTMFLVYSMIHPERF